MTNITPTMQCIAFDPETTAGSVIYGETIPTGAPGRTLKGVEVVNGIEASDTTALVVKVWKGAIDTGDLLATVTWSKTQAAWTGVYEDIVGTATVGASGAVVTSTTNCFEAGDVLTVEIDAAATTSSTGHVILFWE